MAQPPASWLARIAAISAPASAPASASGLAAPAPQPGDLSSAPPATAALACAALAASAVRPFDAATRDRRGALAVERARQRALSASTFSPRQSWLSITFLAPSGNRPVLLQSHPCTGSPAPALACRWRVSLHRRCPSYCCSTSWQQMPLLVTSGSRRREGGAGLRWRNVTYRARYCRRHCCGTRMPACARGRSAAD